MARNLTGFVFFVLQNTLLMLEENAGGEIAAGGVSQLSICCGLFGH